MERVTGIGGVFFRAQDPVALTRWYADHLGVDPPPDSYDIPSWWQQAGPTVFAAMPADSKHFEAPDRAWSVSFRVADLDAMVHQLRGAGVAVVVDAQTYPNGRFASLQDPEGNGIQLWEAAGADLHSPTPSSESAARVLQMRLVVETADYDEALAFYRDRLGAPVELQVHGHDGEKVTILDVGRATLELSNPEQVAMIDHVEVGRRVAPRLRVAFEVADVAAVTDELVEAGAALVAPPTRTPWDSLNSRLEAPADLQLTLFEELR